MLDLGQVLSHMHLTTNSLPYTLFHWQQQALKREIDIQASILISNFIYKYENNSKFNDIVMYLYWEMRYKNSVTAETIFLRHYQWWIFCTAFPYIYISWWAHFYTSMSQKTPRIYSISIIWNLTTTEARESKSHKHFSYTVYFHTM